jgi:hypothetical protein
MKKNKVSPLDFNSLIPSKINDIQENSSFDYNKFSFSSRTEGNNYDGNYSDTGRSAKSNDDYNYHNKKNSNNNNNNEVKKMMNIKKKHMNNKISTKKGIKHNSSGNITSIIKDNKFNKMSSKKDLLNIPNGSSSKLSYNSSPSMNILDDFNSFSKEIKVKNNFEYISKKENPKHLRNDLVKLNSENQLYKEDIQKSSQILHNLHNELTSLTSKISEDESIPKNIGSRHKDNYNHVTYESDESDSYYLGNILKNQPKVRIHTPPPQTVDSEDECETNEIESRSGLLVNSQNIILINKIQAVEQNQIDGFQNLNNKISNSQQVLNELIQNQNDLELNIIKLKENEPSNSHVMDIDESKINKFSKDFDLMKEENKSIKLILQSEITRSREMKNNITEDILKWTEGEMSFKSFIKSEIDILKNANTGNGHEFPLPLFLTSRIEKIENIATENNNEIVEIRLLQDELIKESQQNQEMSYQISHNNEEFMISSSANLNGMKEDIMTIVDKKFTKQFNGMKILNDKIKETQASHELFKSTNKNQVVPLINDENDKEIKTEIIPIEDENINHNLFINSQYVASAISDIMLLKKYLKLENNDDKAVSFIDELKFGKTEKEIINSCVSKPLSIFIDSNNKNNSSNNNNSNIEEYKLNLESNNEKLSKIEKELDLLKENMESASSSSIISSPKPAAVSKRKNSFFSLGARIIEDNKDDKFKELEEKIKLLISSNNEGINVLFSNINDKTNEHLENYKSSTNLELKSLHADINEIIALRDNNLVANSNESEKIASNDSSNMDESLNSFKMELNSLSIEVNKLKDLQTEPISNHKAIHDESDNVESVNLEVKNLVKEIDEMKILISKTNTTDNVNNNINTDSIVTDNLNTELKTLHGEVSNLKINLTDEIVNKTKQELHNSIEKLKSDLLDELGSKDNSNMNEAAKMQDNNNNLNEFQDSIEKIKSDLLEQIRIEEEIRKEEIKIRDEGLKIGKDNNDESNNKLVSEINEIRELMVPLIEENEKLKEENSEQIQKYNLKLDELREENLETKNMLLSFQTFQTEKFSTISASMEERFKSMEEKNKELVEKNFYMNIQIEKLNESKSDEKKEKSKASWGKLRNLTIHNPKKAEKSINKKIDKLRSKEKELNKERSEHKRTMKDMLLKFTDEHDRQPTDAELDQPEYISFKIVFILFLFLL